MDESEDPKESSPAVEGLDGEVPADFTKEAEPLSADRMSPYAIGAFVTALLGLFASQQSSFPFGPFENFFWFAVPSLPTLVAAVIALWLVARAREEIRLSDGRLGGVGLYRAARIIALHRSPCSL